MALCSTFPCHGHLRRLPPVCHNQRCGACGLLVQSAFAVVGGRLVHGRGRGLVYPSVRSPATHLFLTRRSVLFLGKLSYSLYGVHFLVLGSVCSWVFISALLFCGYLSSSALAFLTLIVITLACARGLYDTVDTLSIWFSSKVGTKALSLLHCCSRQTMPRNSDRSGKQTPTF